MNTSSKHISVDTQLDCAQSCNLKLIQSNNYTKRWYLCTNNWAGIIRGIEILEISYSTNPKGIYKL